METTKIRKDYKRFTGKGQQYFINKLARCKLSEKQRHPVDLCPQATINQDVVNKVVSISRGSCGFRDDLKRQDVKR